MTVFRARVTSAGIARALLAYVRLELARTVRNRRYVMFAAGFPVFFYLLYTNLGGRTDPSHEAEWRTYFLVSMAAYGAMGAALFGANVVARERATGWTRQLRVTPLPPAGYVGAKLLVSFATSLPSLVLVAAAAIVVNDVALPATTWLELLAELALGTLPFVGLGMLIGLTVGVDNAQIVVMVSYLGMAVVGGLWAPLSSLPDVVATVGRVLPSFRLADLGWRTVAGQPIEATDVVALIGYTLAVALLVAWAYRRQETAAGG